MKLGAKTRIVSVSLVLHRRELFLFTFDLRGRRVSCVAVLDQWWSGGCGNHNQQNCDGSQCYSQELIMEGGDSTNTFSNDLF